ncbi:sperm motility kinase 2A-like [Apodemus sylvaticus]|uniref:sperm motility kinase 2A-like n=1 Tax=Apodemus sylvaticus TaxID=10129 RepID=UPI002242CE40|nr:sperm motility kinase 2A-like [Apodemus sylvaticus]
MKSGSEEESENLRSDSSFFEAESFHSQYRVLNTIGHGGCATVKLAKHRLTGTPVAVKMIDKQKHRHHPVTSEVDIMTRLNHPNIISLQQVIQTEKTIYLVMELSKGESLYDYIHHAGPLQEDEARTIFKQILSAISYCHDLGIIHRDLKPGNIMIDRKGVIKLIDFGLSTLVNPGQKLNFHCGTLPYAPPEIVLGRLYDGPKVDIWALGVALYYMTAGRVPFDAVKVPELRRQILSGQYPVPSGISIELDDLISILLSANPKHRPTVAEVMLHPWLTEDSEGFPDPCQELFHLKPDPAIIKAMGHLGFKAQEIKESLLERKYNEAMATYYFLRRQALQEFGIPTRAQPMNLLMTPFPSLHDPDSFQVGRRRESESTLCLTSSTSEGSVSGQKALQGRQRRGSWPGIPPGRTLQTTPTTNQADSHSTSVPYVTGSSNLTIDHNPSASAKDKTVPSRRHRGFKWWRKKISNALRKLCCCIPSQQQPHLGERRVSPQN